MGFKNEPWMDVIYFEYGGTGNGKSANDPLPLTDDADLDFGLEAGVVVQAAHAIVTTTATGLTDMAFGVVGDDDCFTAATDVDATAATYVGSGGSLNTYFSSAKNYAVNFTGTISAGAIAVALIGYRVEPVQ